MFLLDQLDVFLIWSRSVFENLLLIFQIKMNARSQTFEFAVEGRQIDEVVSCMFHTILFHRCVGKVCPKSHRSLITIDADLL